MNHGITKSQERLVRLGRSGRSRRWGLWRRGSEWSETGRRIQPRRKIVDKSSHRGVPQAVEAEEIHFFDGLVGGPFLEGDAISGDENAGAIVAEAAVQEGLLPGIVVEEREKLDKLFVGGRSPAPDGDLDKTHAQGFGALALPRKFFAVFAAQVNDGGDAEDFQFRKANFPGLRAAIEDFGNFSAVGNTVNVQFLAESGLGKGWRGRLRNRLRRRLRKKRKRKSEKEGESGENSFHDETGRSSVA
jgi:hypothetical protein